MSALEIKNLVKQFDGVRAIDDLTLEIPEGLITGIVGPNGSGKSTLINVLTGYMSFEAGIIRLGKTVLKNLKPHGAPIYGITRTFQNIRLFEQMPVLDNILVVLTERNVFGAIFERHGKWHLAQAREVLERVGLWEKRTELARNLSYGQRKLLEIGRVLAMCRTQGSRLVFFDEPFAGLFPEMAKSISEILKELRTHGVTVILVEHDMGVIRELCDHVIVMDSGKLLAEGRPGDVLEKRVVIEAYLGF